MKHNQIIRSKKDLLKHFGSSRKLEIVNLEQVERFLEMNVPPEVWEDASNRNLLSFSQEFIKQTTEFGFNNREKEHIYLVSFLTNLTELSLCDNNISDISSISKLKNLNNLNLSINIIEDISALQSLTDLNHLNLQVNKLTSYTLALPNLVELLLDSNKLKDISGVQHSPKLERLYLSLTESADLRTIPCQLFGLKELYLSKNNLTEISHLSNFLDLQILSLHDNNQLQHIVPLKFCAQLTELTISATSISDIWPIQFMKQLKTLYMAQTQIDDLHPLQHLYKLQNISAPYSGIIDVSPLSKLTQLNFLSFSFNKITNAETLKHHQNFSKYSLQGQKVPTTDELKFYNKILSVHKSHKKIRNIMYYKNIQQSRASLASKKIYVSTMLNNQIMMINKEVDLLVQFIQNQNTYLD
ncbi:Conserved_hypothetical protein [Hexamita inflata]|uniref:Uncharacterized protein n=1 Tax=Hexamita inflata TaxID=28002 RepID=A0ABP1HM34_9EUKA